MTPTDPDEPAADASASPDASAAVPASGPDPAPGSDPAPGPTPAAGAHYRRPGWFTRNVFNRAVAGLTRLGVSVWGSRVLEVPGRRSGAPRRTPVNLLTVDGRDHLVSPRGHTQWVLNVRANGGRLDLLVGSRRTSYVATELADADKPDVLRAYLKRWKAEVGVFFDGIDAGSSDEELLAQAPKHPVFALEPAPAPAAPPD